MLSCVICGSVQIGKFLDSSAVERWNHNRRKFLPLGMGAIVTKSVDAEAIVFGNPARKKI